MRLLLFRNKFQPGVAYKSVPHKKRITFFWWSSKHEILSVMSLFLCLHRISLGQYFQKNVKDGWLG